MNLFFYKATPNDPNDSILIIVTKLATQDEFNKLEDMTHEIFQILIDQNEATTENILIFSIIKDYEKTTINLILPSIKSCPALIEKYHNDPKFTNTIIIEKLNNTDTNFFLELCDSSILIHHKKLNLMAFSKYYSI